MARSLDRFLEKKEVQPFKSRPLPQTKVSSMQSQQQTKGEVIAELRGKTDSFSIKDIGANGIKIENNDVGQITGKYQANFMETVSIHMKTDGTSEWEGKSIQMAGKDMVVATSH